MYFINLDEDVAMKKRLQADLGKHTDRLVRVPAVDVEQVAKCLDDGSCGKEEEAKVLGRDFNNTAGFLYWQLHRMNIFSSGELGCTLSHLKAIQQACYQNTTTIQPFYHTM